MSASVIAAFAVAGSSVLYIAWEAMQGLTDDPGEARRRELSMLAAFFCLVAAVFVLVIRLFVEF